MESDIREGFLCPICLKDLKSPTNLASHFEDFHADDKDVLKQVRSMFGKAKRKILKQDENLNTTPNSEVDGYSSFISNGTPGSGGIDLSLWEEQSVGFRRSHMKLFRMERKEKIERCVVETNKLLIRLEKLIKSGIYASDSSMPGALKARKNIEKSLVPWESDSDVKYCRYCMKKFSMTYRRHHCRLCGKVICEKCSEALSMETASDILKLDETTSSALIRNNDDIDPENGVRSCESCNQLLERHAKLCKDKSANNVLIQLYQKMATSMREADSIQPLFLKMADSVNAGETEYGLETALETRFRLLKCYEAVESLSKKINFLGMDREPQPHPNILRLQRSIRSFASNYLADNMFTLPGLPSKEKFAALLRDREQERERKKAEKLLVERTMSSASMKRRVSPAMQSLPNGFTHSPDNISQTSVDGAYTSDGYDSDASSSSSRKGSSKFRPWKKDIRTDFAAVSISKSSGAGDGWGPVNVTANAGSDPIVQQIEIIRGYMRQARQEKKWDELKMFEENLKELELVYMQQRSSGES